MCVYVCMYVCMYVCILYINIVIQIQDLNVSTTLWLINNTSTSILLSRVCPTYTVKHASGLIPEVKRVRTVYFFSFEENDIYGKWCVDVRCDQQHGFR